MCPASWHALGTLRWPRHYCESSGTRRNGWLSNSSGGLFCDLTASGRRLEGHLQCRSLCSPSLVVILEDSPCPGHLASSWHNSCLAQLPLLWQRTWEYKMKGRSSFGLMISELSVWPVGQHSTSWWSMWKRKFTHLMVSGKQNKRETEIHRDRVSRVPMYTSRTHLQCPKCLSFPFFLSSFLFFPPFFWDRILLCSLGYPVTHYEDQAGLKLLERLLLLPPKCWY